MVGRPVFRRHVVIADVSIEQVVVRILRQVVIIHCPTAMRRSQGKPGEAMPWVQGQALPRPMVAPFIITTPRGVAWFSFIAGHRIMTSRFLGRVRAPPFILPYPCLLPCYPGARNAMKEQDTTISRNGGTNGRPAL